MSLVRAHDSSTTNARSQSFAAFLDLRGKVLDKFFARDDLAPEILAMKAIAYRNLYVFEGNMWIGAGNWGRASGAFARAVRTGGTPLDTLARIMWFSVAARVLGRTRPGRKLMQWDSARRLRKRARNATIVAKSQ